VDGVPVVWEACHTFSGSWGYHRDEASWKSVEQLLTLLIEAVSKGGNFLLNVGPTARGEFDERALARLEGIGQWMRRHSRAIYGCTQAPDEFKPPPDCRLTYNPETNCLYVHILAWPCRHLHLDGYGKKVAYAQLLHDASEVKIIRDQKKPDDITLELPVLRPNVAVAVVELFLR
ncbi:MAG TPA: alpha-L-fucosidase, partial [bacterium]|nr:alpha-L-fucosidase [bacterium]